MKKSILTVVTAIAFVMIGNAATAQSNNDQNLIGKARGAAHECLQPYHNNGIAIEGNVMSLGTCSVKGNALRAVTFNTTVHCPQEPCAHPASLIIATVYFDCDDKVISVECTQ